MPSDDLRGLRALVAFDIFVFLWTSDALNRCSVLSWTGCFSEIYRPMMFMLRALGIGFVLDSKF